MASDMPPKRNRREESGRQQHGAALNGGRYDAVKEGLEEVLKELEQERQIAEEERALLLTEAQEVVAKLKEDAEVQVEEMRRGVTEDRAAFEAEKAVIENAFTLQMHLLDTNLDDGGLEILGESALEIGATVQQLVAAKREALNKVGRGVCHALVRWTLIDST
jgi:hypothetical protein